MRGVTTSELSYNLVFEVVTQNGFLSSVQSKSYIYELQGYNELQPFYTPRKKKSNNVYVYVYVCTRTHIYIDHKKVVTRCNPVTPNFISSNNNMFRMRYELQPRF